MRRSSLMLGLVVTVLLAACTTAAPDPQPTPAPRTPAATASAVPFEDAQVGDAEIDDALAFILALLDPATEVVLDEATFDDRFAPRFRDQIALGELTQVLEGVRAGGPYTVSREVSRSEVGELVVRAEAADGTELVISMAITTDGQISGLLLSPGEPPALETPVATLPEAVEALSARGTLHLSAATVVDGECTTGLGVAADQQAPVASAAKLYVLAAVVEAIAAGDLTWEDQLLITADVKSLPSGELQDRPDLSRVTVQEAAQLMIAASDNTATDLLMRTVGRAAVEQAQAPYGHREPQRNTPFPTTREMFLLKAADPSLQQRWVEGDEAGRRDVLASLADADLPDVGLFTGDPILPQSIEWFASPEDLCRVMSRLLDRAEDEGMGPLEEILTTTVGVPDTEGLWQRIAFKGGSEPGLLSAVWVVEDADGVRRALAASLLDPDAPLDEVQDILLLGAARDLLGAG